MTDRDQSDSAGLGEIHQETDGHPDVLTPGEKAILAPLKKLGLEYLGHGRSLINFRRPDEPMHRSDVGIPRDSIPELADQLDDELVNHPGKLGFVIPSRGFAEIVIREGRPGSATERLLRLRSDEFECAHKEPGGELPSLPYRTRLNPDAPTGEARKIHLVNGEGGPCVELSNASPLAMLLYGPRAIWVEGRAPLIPTVKVDYGSRVDHQSLVRRTDELVRSLIYELDIRNGRVLGSVARPLPRSARSPALSRNNLDSVRYPQVRIEFEVADLFSFAGHAYDNPPLAFLSYYQTLEYFTPSAVRQSTFKTIRRELRDPKFDRESDTSILRIVSAAERSSRFAEADQLRTLVREYVRRNRLEEFFAADWGNYFTKHGPISGVEIINASNPTKDLGDQVADRIYRIRNRIVHAKDDPRYEDARVMLPRSQEAAALRPDIELVRLLAMEAILASQGT